MTFTPTPEQLAIVEAARETKDNILVSATAGAAKTSTLELIANALPDVQILCLAFNKKIAVEMQERMPPNVKAMTLNGLGHRTWMDASGRRLTLDKDKTYTLLSEAAKDLTGTSRDEVMENFSQLLKIIAFGKQCGYVPTGHFSQAKRLMEDHEFFEHLDDELTEAQQDIVTQVTVAGIKLALAGTIDFDDQIFMPTLFQGAFPRYQLTLVDEAQDLSALNHATLRKMIGQRRLIAVGDQRQAIYGFRGAHEDSMNKLREEFSMKELELTTTFRCAERITDHARWRAPQMRAHRPGGEVRFFERWSVNDVPIGSFILCRNNAPLFRSALNFLKAGRAVELSSGDVAKTLAKIMAKFGDKRMLREDVLRSIVAWVEKERAKVKERAWGVIDDKAECMRIFATQGETLGEALDYIHHLTVAAGPTKLFTIHKAKGLEADNIFILDEHLIGKEGQDPNLRYVAQTRARDFLGYIETEGYLP